MKFFLFFLMIFVFAVSIANAQFSVLLVDDDQNVIENGPIIDALTNWSGTFDVDTTSETGIPDATELSNYDMVIWYTGNDGSGLRLWDVSDTAGVGPGAVKFNAALTDFVDNGGILWIDGLDFLYDLYGSAPDDFAAGDFVYDKLGITQYIAQSHADDGTFSDGVQQYDIASTNSITTVNPISWVYSTLWYADALAINNNAVALYQMGPSGYDFEGDISAFYYNNIIVSGFRLGKINTQANTDQLISEMITAAQNGTFAAPASVNEVSGNNIKIYPNPAVNSTIINLTSFKNASSLKVVDITGRTVFSKEITGQKPVNINTNNFATGIYNVIISDGKNKVTAKLSVVK